MDALENIDLPPAVHLMNSEIELNCLCIQIFEKTTLKSFHYTLIALFGLSTFPLVLVSALLVIFLLLDIATT